MAVKPPRPGEPGYGRYVDRAVIKAHTLYRFKPGFDVEQAEWFARAAVQASMEEASAYIEKIETDDIGWVHELADRYRRERDEARDQVVEMSHRARDAEWRLGRIRALIERDAGCTSAQIRALLEKP